MNTAPFNPSTFLAGDEIVRRIQTKYARMFKHGDSVLDLGCGSGVFLELLRDHGVRGIGVDSFDPCIVACRGKGLEVHQAELMEFLRGDAGSYDGIFCSHIVEHLPADTVLALIGIASERLRPGGRLIIMTPNPRNLDVIAENFWLDITHVRPYPIPLLESMMIHHGFVIETSGLDPDTGTPLLSKHPLIMARRFIKKIRFGEYWGTGDTVVIGRIR
jgi:SAM-dependent methyltransferase